MSDTRTLPHGIDITAPGGIDQLFAFHRATFGDAVMEADGGAPAGDGGAPAGGAPAGDGGNNPDGGAPAGNPAGDGGAPSGQAGGGAPATGDSTPPWGDPANFDPERAWKLIEGLREDKNQASQRVTDAAQKAAEDAKNELAQSIGKALGIIKDDQPADPEELLKAVTTDRDTVAQERDGAREEARLAKIELAIYRGADDHGANAAELLDSRAFANEYAALDPTADDFASKVSELVSTWKEKNPQKFGIAQVASRSGGDFQHGNGGEQLPSDDIESLRKARQERRRL